MLDQEIMKLPEHEMCQVLREAGQLALICSVATRRSNTLMS